MLALSSGWTKTSPCHLHDQNLCLPAFYDTLVEFSQSHTNIQIYTRKTQRWFRSLLFSRRACSRPYQSLPRPLVCRRTTASTQLDKRGSSKSCEEHSRNEAQDHWERLVLTETMFLRRALQAPQMHNTQMSSEQARQTHPAPPSKPPCSESRKRLTSQNTTEVSRATIAYTADVRRSVFTVMTTSGEALACQQLIV